MSTLTNDLARLANSANVLVSAITTNGSAITSVSVGGITINSSGYTGDANNATYLGGSNLATIEGHISNAYSNATAYADTKAAAAYANSKAYTDASIAAADNATAAYINAVSYTDTKIGTANTAMIANASAAYSNSVTYVDTKIGTANSAIVANAGAAYTNSVSYTDIKIGTANSAITGNAATAYSNAVSYTDTKIGLVNTAISANASAAYTNATTYSSNASNISSGTVAEARLPYRMDQNVRTSDNVEFAQMTLTGNLVVSGNVNIIGANNLSVSDNMIYLNSNNDVTSPDIGIAGNYNDGVYAHTGIFRDATDGIWKVFDNYTPEPDANVYIDTTNTSFHVANFQANTYYGGNTSTNWFIANNSGVYTGIVNASAGIYGTLQTSSQPNITANNASYLGGTAAASYALLASPTFSGTLSATNVTVSANLTVAASGKLVLTSGSGIYANGEFGTAGHVLHSNGSSVYWAADDVNTGTVTSIVAGTGLSGGTITSSGTISIAADYSPNLATDIPGSVDLNTYQTAGFYYQSLNSEAASGSNYPIALAGSLFIQKSAGVTQQYQTYNTTGAEFYFRSLYSGTWGPWRKVLTDSNYVATTGGQVIPTGTRMTFQQTAAPTGFTKVTTYNDYAMRIVSGTVGTGGSVAFSTAFASQAVSGSIGSTSATGTTDSTTVTGTVGSTTLDSTMIPSHGHSVGISDPGHNHNTATVAGSSTGYGLGASIGGVTGSSYATYPGLLTQTKTTGITVSQSNVGGGLGHNHTFTGTAHTHTFTGTAHNHTFTGTAINMAVNYVDFILATAN